MIYVKELVRRCGRCGTEIFYSFKVGYHDLDRAAISIRDQGVSFHKCEATFGCYTEGYGIAHPVGFILEKETTDEKETVDS